MSYYQEHEKFHVAVDSIIFGYDERRTGAESPSAKAEFSACQRRMVTDGRISKAMKALTKLRNEFEPKPYRPVGCLHGATLYFSVKLNAIPVPASFRLPISRSLKSTLPIWNWYELMAPPGFDFVHAKTNI